jgi:RNA polymerase sigma factor (sigma-70 family)
LVAVPSIGRADRPQLAHAAPEADATRRLYEQYARQIYAYCLQQLRSKEEAEDATQSTFLNAFRGLQRGVDPEFESAWLYKIAHNVCLTRQRSSTRRRRVESPGDLDAIQDVLPAREVESDELIGLPEALHDMPEQQRRALLLREWQGLSYREIADELELSQAAVETLIFRARRTLANGLSDEGRGGLAKRITRGGDLSSLAAILKSLLFTGGAKVVATVATVAATSVVAATPTARHAVEHVVVSLDPPAAKRAPAVVHHATPVAAPAVARRITLAAAPTAAHTSIVREAAAGKRHAAKHSAVRHGLLDRGARHAVPGHVPADPAAAPVAPVGAASSPTPPATPTPTPPAAAPTPTPAPAPAPTPASAPAPAPAPTPTATPAPVPVAATPAAPAQGSSHGASAGAQPPVPVGPAQKGGGPDQGGNGKDKDKGNGNGRNRRTTLAAPIAPVLPTAPAPQAAPPSPAPGNAGDHAIHGPALPGPSLPSPVTTTPATTTAATTTTPAPAPPAPANPAPTTTTAGTTPAPPLPAAAPPNARPGPPPWAGNGNGRGNGHRP